MFELRYYQGGDIDRLSTSFSTGVERVCYQLPTGGGKTVMFCDISKRYINRNEDSVLIVVHRDELLRQTKLKLYLEYDIVPFEIVAGCKHIPPARVYVAMVESLSKRLQLLPKIGLLILDEAHLAIHNKIVDKLPPC